MKVLVTGAAGFIGGQLWHTLWQRGDEVVGIDNFSYGNLDNLKFDDHDFGSEVRRMTSATAKPCPSCLKKKSSMLCITLRASRPCRTARATPCRPLRSTPWAWYTCWNVPAAPA